jgi:very-short-patch-repair endonuclease
LLDSKDEPWSAAERKFHRLLRDAGITAWKANQLVVLGGSLFFLDVVFRGVKLAVELDGRLYHSGSEVFETDRWRQNLLVLDGWCLLRFTSAMIEERPAEVMAMVREASRCSAPHESRRTSPQRYDRFGADAWTA